MEKNKLTTADITLCYKKAHKKLSSQDRININYHMEEIGLHLTTPRGKPASDFLRMEILAKLGQWMNREHPIEE